MTGARRRKKAKLCGLIAAGALAILVAAAAGTRQPTQAATTDHIVYDSLSGLALSGFDPVAYYTDRKPRLGKGIHEVTYRGVVWRFRNVGNMAAFERDPEVYVPAFGGYDPVAAAGGVAVPGHPLIWLISDNRLYLFSKPEHRSKFAAEFIPILAAARHHWPGVAATLAP